VRKRTFIGAGIPPRATTCDVCGAPIAIGVECVANENSYRDETLCSIACYAERYPHDPALPAIVPPKAAARPADDDNETW
jgi:hypothetical protein